MDRFDDLRRLFIPPEWPAWHWIARAAYLVVFAGLMIPVVMFARWFSSLLFAG
jgi:hypothetical protein